MSVISDLTEKANDKLKILEDLTSNVKQIQDNVLEEILTLNTNTEYLQRFFHGKFDKEIFKKNVPVVTYEDVKPYIQRVANGEPSNVISTRPITGFLLSSGTSGGAQKIMPWNEKFLDYLTFMYDLRKHVITNYVKGLEKGKAMMFYFTKLESITPSGLPARIASSSYLKSSYFKNRPWNWYYTYTSPDEVILCPDNKQSLYCHLLCGLVQRNEVTRMGSIFASVMVRAIKSLENSWEEFVRQHDMGLEVKSTMDRGREGPSVKQVMHSESQNRGSTAPSCTIKRKENKTKLATKLQNRYDTLLSLFDD